MRRPTASEPDQTTVNGAMSYMLEKLPDASSADLVADRGPW